MSTVSQLPLSSDVTKAAEYGAISKPVTRVADYLEIVKPKISMMVLLTVSCGYVLGMETSTVSITLLHACLGIAVVAVGSSAINQWIERETDGRMRRTKNRPLPSGRLAPSEVLIVGFLAAIIGCTYLTVFVNPLTALLTGMTFVLYAGVYTPLKRYTSLCTVVGAIPGALPPVLGWTAAGGRLDYGAFALFGTLFLWQFPHFFAIAWLYRDDYCQAGLRMLPAGKSLPRVTGLLAVVYALGLIPVSLLPSQFGMAGSFYSSVALGLGIAYLAASMLFAWNETRTSARRLLLTSLVYLPALLLVLVWDHQRLLDRF
ncbi:heme o synthase [Schlesneria paludicola]|uniref:heme o synthase n=1 Tax=Schlesneria paludicola TaxID=360056 RepID=UPI00029AFFD7|nr:heme o synthase [Schlesneria paludicola]